VQHTQQNCWRSGAAFLGFLALLSLGNPSLGAPAAAPDPLLTGTKGPCDPKLDGPDYVAGTDVDGNPVVPADVDQAKVQVPGGVLVPLGRPASSRNSVAQNQTLMALNQKQVDSILDPQPACPPAHKAH
jgi:hypothetical protein